MSRILVPKLQRWFDELRIVSYYSEGSIEHEILNHVADLFPDFHVVVFKRDVVSRSTGDTKRPDLAMVRKDLATWAIMEVELGTHGLQHVIDQAETFRDGEYNSVDTAKAIRAKMQESGKPMVPLGKLRTLLAKQSPSVYVLVDRDVEKWESALKKLGIEVCVFEPYKSPEGTRVYRTCGAYPWVPVEKAHCRRHKSLANTLSVVGQFKFHQSASKKPFDITYDGALTQWRLLSDGQEQCIRFVGSSNPLAADHTYCLSVDTRKRYYLTPT